MEGARSRVSGLSSKQEYIVQIHEGEATASLTHVFNVATCFYLDVQPLTPSIKFLFKQKSTMHDWKDVEPERKHRGLVTSRTTTHGTGGGTHNLSETSTTSVSRGQFRHMRETRIQATTERDRERAVTLLTVVWTKSRSNWLVREQDPPLNFPGTRGGKKGWTDVDWTSMVLNSPLDSMPD